jgi:tRNA threonylcarbamoyladenosine modification (KEOPS) complex  Pcc1 subunit
MTSKASFLFFFPTPKDALVVSQSLLPEIKHKIPKSNITFFVENKTLKVTIESDDISSLRAACNSYLRWIQTALAVKQLV